MMKNVVAVTWSKVPVLSTCISGGVHISRCTGGLRLSGFSSWCVMAMSGELAQHGVGDEQDRGVARSKYVGWTNMASAERKPITGVWRRSDPLPLPLQKLVGFVSISGATSSKSGVDMFTPVHPATGDGHPVLLIHMDRTAVVDMNPTTRLYTTPAAHRTCSRAFQFAIRIDSIRFLMRIDSNRFV